MNLQDFFTKGVEGICAQGKPAVNRHPPTTCQYRAFDGSKCIIGHSIPEGEYEPNFEGNGVASHPPLLRALRVDPDDRELVRQLGRMQREVHDNPAMRSLNNEDFMFEFKQAARKFGLLENLELPSCIKV